MRNKPRARRPADDRVRSDADRREIRSQPPGVAEDVADKARAQHAERLRRLGAHGVMVEKVKGSRNKFAVVALCTKPPQAVPASLKTKVDHKTVDVPLIARKAERFKPE